MVQTPPAAVTANAADTAIAFARMQIGKPYVWGATGPNSWDCSGLVQGAYKHAGITLPRTTYQQVKVGKPVARAELQPGDIIFPNPGHEQLYVGSGKVIEAPEAGVPVREVPVWGFWQARRVTAPGSGSLVAPPPSVAAGVAPSNSGSFAGSVAAIEWIISPHNWLRITEAISGGILIIFAVRKGL